MIHIVTDTTSQLTPAEIEKYRINLVSLRAIANGKTYKDQIDITSKEFSDILASDQEFPTTSQPSLGDFVETYQKIIDDDPDAQIISIHIGTVLSGTANTAQMAAQQFDNDIRIVDGGTADRGTSYLVLKAGQMLQNGFTLDDIEKEVTAMIPNTKFYLFINNMDYLVKGGRASKATGFISSLIKLKPVVTVQNNQLNFAHKCRGKKQMEKIVQKVIQEIIGNPNIKDVGLPFVDDDLESKQIRDAILAKRPDINIVLNYTSPSLMPHAGPEGFAITYNDKY